MIPSVSREQWKRLIKIRPSLITKNRNFSKATIKEALELMLYDTNQDPEEYIQKVEKKHQEKIEKQKRMKSFFNTVSKNASVAKR